MTFGKMPARSFVRRTESDHGVETLLRAQVNTDKTHVLSDWMHQEDARHGAQLIFRKTDNERGLHASASTLYVVAVSSTSPDSTQCLGCILTNCMVLRSKLQQYFVHTSNDTQFVCMSTTHAPVHNLQFWTNFGYTWRTGCDREMDDT